MSILFTDLERSTETLDPLGDRRSQPVFSEHLALLRELVTGHGGVVVKSTGDGVMATFPFARGAVDCAMAVQRAAMTNAHEHLDAPLRVRIGIHTGEPVPDSGDLYGRSVVMAARIMAEARGGEILVSSLVRDITEPAGDLVFGMPRTLPLRGLSGTHTLSPVVWTTEPPGLSAVRPPVNLPVSFTSFVGREREISELERLLESARLVTLTGVGGCGKTRLAVEVARRLVEGYPDGVWFADLSSLGDPTLVVQSVASAVGVREEPGQPVVDSLARFLSSRKALLVLDNCEHLVEACARVAGDLLRACMDVRILATSRESLGVESESTFPVPSLTVPDPSTSEGVDSLLQAESVRLFKERAIAVDRRFAPTDEDVPALAQICTRLDGIPLALELAAVRVKVLTPKQIASRLDDQLGLLARGGRTKIERHQTLRATLDWSYELLDDDEQMLLRRLGVFAGRFSLEAAESACSEDGLEKNRILDLLTALVDKSLVEAKTQEGARLFRLLEPVRQFVSEKLRSSGEGPVLHVRHWDYYLAFARRAEPELIGPAQEEWFARLDAEYDNLRAALKWSSDENAGPYTPLRLAGSLWGFWVVGGRLSEGRGWLEKAFAIDTGSSPALRAWALYGLGQVTMGSQGDDEAVRVHLEESIRIAREIGEVRILSLSLGSLGNLLWDRGDPGGPALAAEALDVARKGNDPWAIASALMNLGEYVERHGDYTEARRLLEESLAVNRAMGNALGMVSALEDLGRYAYWQGDYAQARSLIGEGMQIAGSMPGGRRETLLCGAGAALFQLGEYEAAEPLLQESLDVARALERTNGDPFLVYGGLAQARGDYATARSVFDENVTRGRGIGDAFTVAASLIGLANVALDEGDHAAAGPLVDESLAFMRRVGWKAGVARALATAGRCHLDRGDLTRARPPLEEALEMRRKMGLRGELVFSLRDLAMLEVAEGDSAEGDALLREGLRLAIDIGQKREVADLLERIGRMTLARGDVSLGLRLFAGGAALREAIGAARPPVDRPAYEHHLSQARLSLGEDAFAAAWEAGRALSVEEAVALALES